jgi:NAD(P)-dependent dehydrogenase (short-subunit alcohol dehydrogenase family)
VTVRDEPRPHGEDRHDRGRQEQGPAEADDLATRPGSGRLAGRVAIVVGAGQSPGSRRDDTTIGNGRATALVFAREGAAVLAVDRDRASAEETVALIDEAGGTAAACAADVTVEEEVAAIPDACVRRFGSPTILHNNVGIGTGDGSVPRMAREVWERIFDVNVTAMMLTCKHVIPAMRAAGGGSIVNISSVAAQASTPLAAYKTSKAAVNALTQHLAMANARYGIRVNAIMPGLMDTPMAIGGHSVATAVDPDELRAARDALVPLGRRQGTGWDTAYAALYLVSDEARFVTGVILPVDGGQLARIG